MAGSFWQVAAFLIFGVWKAQEKAWKFIWTLPSAACSDHFQQSFLVNLFMNFCAVYSQMDSVLKQHLLLNSSSALFVHIHLIVLLTVYVMCQHILQITESLWAPRHPKRMAYPLMIPINKLMLLLYLFPFLVIWASMLVAYLAVSLTSISYRIFHRVFIGASRSLFGFFE